MVRTLEHQLISGINPVTATTASDPLAIRNMVDMQFVSDEKVGSPSAASWSNTVGVSSYDPLFGNDSLGIGAVLNDSSDLLEPGNRNKRSISPLAQ